jgi:hypothetical protein
MMGFASKCSTHPTNWMVGTAREERALPTLRADVPSQGRPKEF